MAAVPIKVYEWLLYPGRAHRFSEDKTVRLAVLEAWIQDHKYQVALYWYMKESRP